MVPHLSLPLTSPSTIWFRSDSSTITTNSDLKLGWKIVLFQGKAYKGDCWIQSVYFSVRKWGKECVKDCRWMYMWLLLFIVFSLLEFFTRELRCRNRFFQLFQMSLESKEVRDQLSEIADWPSARGIIGCILQSLSKYYKDHLNSPSLHYSDFMCFEVLLFYFILQTHWKQNFVFPW